LSGCGFAAAINGKLYLYTPCNGYSGAQSLLDVYDPVANTWTSLPSGPHPLGNGVGGAINGKLYAVGDSNGNPSAILDVYDPVANSWSTLAPMPSALSNMNGTVLNGKLYVLGGITSSFGGSNTVVTTTYVYDPVANSWSTQASLPFGVRNGAAASQGGDIYLDGGSSDVYGYDVVTTLEIFGPAPSSVCTVSGSTVTITGVGNCIVAADQPGNASYGAAPEVTYTIVVNKGNPVITWATPAAIPYGTPLSGTQLDATANVPGSFFYTSPAGLNPAGTVLPAGTSPLGAGFTPTNTQDYNPISAYVLLTVTKASTLTSLSAVTTQSVTGTTATLTAVVRPQISGSPTGTVTYKNGSTTLGSAPVGTAFSTGVLPVGNPSITAVYSGDANFTGSSSAATTVVSVAPTTVQLTPALTRVLYPLSSVPFSVTVPLKNSEFISGSITLYDGTTVINTYSVSAGGIFLGVTPSLSVGTHSLRAVYSGDSHYPPGESPIVAVTVSQL
jgi:hypothetical protein